MTELHEPTVAPISPGSRLLTINGGSSSIKYAVYEADEPGRSPRRILVGTVGRDDIAALFDRLESDGQLAVIVGVGHRIVHGGPNRFDPQRVTPELMADLKRAVALDPNHLPAEIALIEAVASRLPTVPQVVLFDTAFFRNMPTAATVLPIPRTYAAAGVHRYGFHGLSYEYLLGALRCETRRDLPGSRMIFAHLGSGASMVALRDGSPIDTTMGFTPAGGLVMGTRTGDIDPGVLIHLARTEGMDADRLDELVNRRSGLLGVSGTGSDMRDLLAIQATDPNAASAVELFCFQARKCLGAYAAILGGLDTIVFSGGIGENSPEIRARICEGLEFLGVRIDSAANAANAPTISSPGCAVTVRAMATDEGATIARGVCEVVGGHPKANGADRRVGGISDESIRGIDACWRAANYLSIGQIYLLDNPLLKEPLKREHVKPRLLGHWGTTPGLNFIYVHLNRAIRQYDLEVLYVAGPGHGGPGIVANVYLEGTYTEFYPAITRDEAGLKRLFRQFSFPGGIGSHCTPETPGSIHEGGELGYSLSHAFGAAFDNPDLIVACVVGDGEAETGPLATAWHSNKFLNPIRDGAVLPILHLNGFKIANPTLLSRIPQAELRKLLEGYGWAPVFVEGDDPARMHLQMADALDAVVPEIRRIQKEARDGGYRGRPTWPMIVLKSPKGWTCPREIDGKLAEGSWRSHQVPIADTASESHLRVLEGWLRSYRPEELFDARGSLRADLAALAPEGTRRMGASRHANGGSLRDLAMPDYRTYAVAVASPGGVDTEATRVQGTFLRDVMKLNAEARNFRVFSPDELASNRWQDVLEVTGRCFVGEIDAADGTRESPDGRAMEVLSEHQCQGWLEGYLLTGRHGFFSCYEAFVHIVDSMFNQHAKWLKVCRSVTWRPPVASLNYLLSSHVWRQDHNGFSHQDPGFLDHVLNKKADIVRVYLPPDANTLLSITDHCLRSRNYVNVVVAGKQSAPQWLDMRRADAHCAAGIGVWEWASSDGGAEPDVVLGCCGDVPTLEALAAVEILRRDLPDLRVRLVNVVDLMKLQAASEHPHGLSDSAFDALFTSDKPIIFAFHGYPTLIHRLTYRRTNHANLHVRGYREEGTTTTPFDMCVINQLDRFNLVLDVIRRVPGLAIRAKATAVLMEAKLAEHRRYIAEHGIDMPEILNWRWATGEPSRVGSGHADTGGDNA